MKKAMVWGLVVLVAVVIVMFLLLNGGEEPAGATKKVDVGKWAKTVEPPSKPVALSKLAFETLEVWEEIEEPEPKSADAAVPQTPEPVVTEQVKTVPAVRVLPDQVLALVNGKPLTARQLLPPGRFKKKESVVFPTEALAEVLERSIQRELVLEQAEVQGTVLGENQQVQLDKMYEHLTSNPLNLPPGQTVKDLNVWGDDADAAYQVRDQAAKMLQARLLGQAGKPDTAEERMAFRDRLWEEADIQVVETTPPGE